MVVLNARRGRRKTRGILLLGALVLFHDFCRAALTLTDVFTDSTAAGWTLSGSNGSTVGVQTALAKSGTSAIHVQFAAGGSLVLDHGSVAFQPQDDTYLTFDFNAGATVAAGIASLSVGLDNGSTSQPLSRYVQATRALTWYHARIPISDLNDQNLPFSRLVLSNNTSYAGFDAYVDNVALEKDDPLTPPPPPLPAPAVSAVFTINTTLPTSISSSIYGVNYPPANLWALLGNHLAMIREGGNRWSAYNWENNASNAGHDYQYSSDNNLVSSLPPSLQSLPGEAVLVPLQDAQAKGMAAMVSVPMQDYVAADESGPVPQAQWAVTPGLTTYAHWNVNLPRSGNPSGAPNIGDKYVYQDQFVYWLETTLPTASRTAPIFYCLDNEPGLWPTTHPEVHPAQPTYVELIRRTTDYASMIKDANPNALVFGPVSWGWTDYVSLQNAPDAAAHTGPDGSWDFLDYYLETVKTESQNQGRRLVDVLDIHWGPQDTANQATGPSLTQTQLNGIVQGPRSLWDPTYKEDSWVTNDVLAPYQAIGGYEGIPWITLIPRMKKKISDHYPGTKLALSEYYMGGTYNIAGGIAQADALGIFGREGVFAATRWGDMSGTNNYFPGAFAMYLNYDGAGGRVGDQSVPVTDTDTVDTSVYAMTDSVISNQIWVVAMNKTANALPVRITVGSGTSFNAYAVFQLTAAAVTPQFIGKYSMSGGGFYYAMPAYSVSTLVLSTTGGGSSPPPVTGDATPPARPTGLRFRP